MEKSKGLLLLFICLTLQLIVAHPLQSDDTAHADDDTKLRGLQQAETTKSNETNFVKALEPVILTTLDGIDKYLNTLIAETARFVDGVLKELTALPDEGEYIRELIPRLTSILMRLNDPALKDRKSLIGDIGDMYADFDSILKRKDDDNRVNVLKKVLDKFQLLELNWRVHSSVDSAVLKFKRAFDTFWDSLSEAQQKEHRRLSDWYEHFKAGKTSQDKLKGFEEFIQIALEMVPIN